MNSRCNLGLRRATASSNSLFNRKADGINGNTSAFPDTFTLETLLVPAEASHSSLFALCSHQERKIRSLFSITCAVFFTLGKRAERHLHSFQSLPHSLQECRGGRPPPRQNTPVSPRRLGRRRQRSAPTPTRQANWIWSLLAIRRCVFVSSHRYFVPSPGETLSRALSSYGEEIPNPSL
jgi:hypothetical protein